VAGRADSDRHCFRFSGRCVGFSRKAKINWHSSYGKRPSNGSFLFFNNMIAWQYYE
jgi:hypothetical protein